MVIVSVVSEESTLQIAFVPQTMSASVFAFPPEQSAGPELVALPQSLSVRRTTAFAAMFIASLKTI